MQNHDTSPGLGHFGSHNLGLTCTNNMILFDLTCTLQLCSDDCNHINLNSPEKGGRMGGNHALARTLGLEPRGTENITVSSR